MADAQKVFANLRDIHELDDVSYLTEEQREMLKRFFANFKDEHNSELKQRFLNLWSHFGDIYADYNKRLRSQGLAYEGALYREVATDTATTFEYDKYLFVGFNMIQQVEQVMFSRLQKESKAHFYWDFDQYYMPHSSQRISNEAGHYIAQYLQQFPNELDTTDGAIYNHLGEKKKITYISAPTENIQARYISEWLRQDQRYAEGKKTAIVLCDERLLQTVTHCLPPEVQKVNITTGYPLSQAPISSLVRQLFQLQTIQNGRYRMLLIKRIKKHPYCHYISDSYIEILKEKSDGQIDWILPILKDIGTNARELEDPLFQESLFRIYTLINRLSDLITQGDLQVDNITLQRLMNQLINSTSIPFHGEPAEGIQIMGVLETRNLDFDHILVLSCNEGNMPKGVNDTSFIPYSIRKAYGLTTIDNKVAIYAYYFHRLLQRATDITLAYNNATEDGHTGEMSRFMLQLMVESGQDITHETLQAGQSPQQAVRTQIEKDGAIMEKLHSIQNLSPSAINKYQRCPLQFYYNYVAGLKEPDNDDSEEIDNRMFGNIFHMASQFIYEKMLQRDTTIRKEDIDYCLKHPEEIAMAVDKALQKELFGKELKNFTVQSLNGLQIINREVIISYLRQLLKIDKELAPFTILGLEKKVSDHFAVTTSEGTHQITIGGVIDRLDKVGDHIRVIDYKTGNTASEKTNNVKEVFSTEKIQKRHSDYYLQTMLYSSIVRHSREWNPGNLAVSPALLFIQHAAGKDYDPTLCFNKDPISDIASFDEEFRERLATLLNEIFEPRTPFAPTEEHERCGTCPYKDLCGL